MYLFGRRLTLSILQILKQTKATRLICFAKLKVFFLSSSPRGVRDLGNRHCKAVQLEIHDSCQKILPLKKANSYPGRIRLRGLVQKFSCKPREVLFCDAALAQPPVTCMPRWRAFCPITQPPRIFHTTCLHTY